MIARRKLILGALGFVVLATALTRWQAMPPDIERVANRLSEADCERSGMLRDSEPDYFREPKTPLVPGRVEALVESWRKSDDGQQTLVVLRTKNQALPEPETWAVLLGDAWPKERHEFWLLSSTGDKPYCLATATLSNIPDGNPSWQVLTWSPDSQWVYLLKRTPGHAQAIYALPL
ncbi:hypothetical protein [Armatimonas sp.]|uniref:hypothetical protein n=1 Tax=Armatimonas sp. TaxID=1872638 RepID=UPI00286B3890|nr:hypothetical protein [Armatimonas sp.]